MVNSGSGLVLILALFLGMFLPALPQVANYHSDEHYYTDSALFMLQQGQYLTPRLPDGTLRTKKPIVSYWALMAAYALVGINFFSARLPFLLSGCILLWLTYRMSLRLHPNRGSAVLAAAILASNIQFVVLSVRSTPDILHALFLNISLYGFLALLFHRECRLRDYLLAYLGAALAVETKGLLGFTPVVFAFAFRWFLKDPPVPLKRLLHWPIIVFAVAVSLGWYLFILCQHGPEALGIFFSDQVAGKVGGNPGYLFSNLWDYAIGILRNFLPWTMILIIGCMVARRTISTFFSEYTKEAWFIIGWFGFLLCIFVVSTDCRTRYLVPAYPLLSVLLASLFNVIVKQHRMAHVWNWCCLLLIGLVGVLGGVLLLCGMLLDWRLILAGLIVSGSGLAALGWLVRNRRRRIFHPVWTALVILVTIASLKVIVLPVFEFAPSKDLTRCLVNAVEGHDPISAWALKRQNYTRQIYLLSRGRVSIRYLSRSALATGLEGKSPVILSADAVTSSTALADYRISPCGGTFHPLHSMILWQMVTGGQRREVMDAMRRPLYLAWRKPLSPGEP